VRGVAVDGVWGICVHAKHHFKPSECSLESTTHECAVPSQCTVMATAVTATTLAFVSGMYVVNCINKYSRTFRQGS